MQKFTFLGFIMREGQHKLQMEYPKVLLVSTVNVIKEYCIDDWIDTIQSLTYPNYDILIIDNSLLEDFSNYIRSRGIDCLHEKPNGRQAREFMATSLERGRVKFLAGNYEYFFSLECDIFPPKDIIERLLAHNLPVVGCTYWTDHGYNTHLQLQTIYNLHTDYQNHTKDYKVRFLSFEEAQLFMDGQCKPIYGAGIGCCLIDRSIIEQFPFRVSDDEVGFADSFFHKDIWQAGIDFMVDTSIIPMHRNSNWNTVLADTRHKIMQAEKGDIKLNK